MKLFNHTLCAVALKLKTNATFIVEVTIKVCLTLFQDITPSAIIKLYFDVDLCELRYTFKEVPLRD